jgi:hypothetical protein
MCEQCGQSTQRHEERALGRRRLEDDKPLPGFSISLATCIRKRFVENGDVIQPMQQGDYYASRGGQMS